MLQLVKIVNDTSAVQPLLRSSLRKVTILGVVAGVVFLGCSGPSRYVIVRVPPKTASALPDEPWPPHDDADVAPLTWCEAACKAYVQGAERTRRCRLVSLGQYSLPEGVACEFR